ncbi:TonB-dependent siderophore receptor [Sphingomonas sp.]|uniref:TonB-dependent siderophore receptor n=1 Tax=Sphingomonas sp. TaxID=28214 RepID=UPI002C3B4698|nr:TonB-dependent siderophore receptor [Sphingomonas sp.]HTG38019.1 TonB-dependent siderophore receptor [Sphingomonas sp.]
MSAAIGLWSLALVLGTSGDPRPTNVGIDADNTADVQDRDIIVDGERDKRPTTSTRLPLSLKETPQSVTVVDRQRIEDFNLNTVADVLAQTPGVTVNTIDSNRSNFNVRGFAVRNFQLDGVPTIYQVSGYENSAVGDMAIYDRVEIVRGAAGLLAGVGDPSATVNLIRKRAPRELRGYFNLTAGSWSYYRMEADVGGPLTRDGAVRARVAAAYTDTESYIDLQHDRNPVVYATIEADVTPHTRLRVGGDYLRTNSQGAGWGTVPLLFNDGTPTDLPRSFTGTANWSTWSREQTTLFAAAEQDIGDRWLLRVSYNRRAGTNESALLNIANGLPDRQGNGLAMWTFYGELDQHEDAVDGYVAGKVRLFGRDHEVVGGVNWFDRSFTVNQSAFDLTGYPTTAPSIIGWTGNLARPPIIQSDAPDWTQGFEQLGAYGVIRLNPADWLKIIAGGRYTDYSSGRDNFRPGVADPAGQDEQRFAPYGGVVVDLTRAVSLYASYASVFSPVSARGADGNLLDPTVGANYEAGVKATPFGEGFTMSAAGFHIRQDNIAVADPTAPLLPDGSTPSISVSGVSTWGGEAELAGEPIAGWTLAASYTYARSEDRTGERVLPQFPLHIARLYTTYRLPGDRLTVGGGVSAQSRMFVTGAVPTGAFNTDGTPVTAPGEVSQGGYALVDLLLRYRVTDQATLGVNVSNLFDHEYYRNVSFGFGGPGGFYGAPRRVMGNIRVGF